jgi:hypothetical protein
LETNTTSFRNLGDLWSFRKFHRNHFINGRTYVIPTTLVFRSWRLGKSSFGVSSQIFYLYLLSMHAHFLCLAIHCIKRSAQLTGSSSDHTSVAPVDAEVQVNDPYPNGSISKSLRGNQCRLWASGLGRQRGKQKVRLMAGHWGLRMETVTEKGRQWERRWDSMTAGLMPPGRSRW